MQKFRIRYAKIPTSYNEERFAIVEAATPEDAVALWRREIERRYGVPSSEFAGPQGGGIVAVPEAPEAFIDGRVVSL